MPASPSSESSRSSELLVNAYVDGELDVAQSLEVKRQIEADPALAAQAANVIALRATLRDKLPADPVSPQLRRRINQSIGAAGTRRDRRPSWRALAASVLVAAMVGSGGTFIALRGERDARLVQVADAHMRSLVAAKPFDVASSERHVVRPWFAGKIPYAPKVADLSGAGFPLVGARIDVVDGNPVAALVYHRRLHVISLFSRPIEKSSDLPVQQRTLKGYNVVSWNEGGTEYWAISDLNAEELKSFAELFRKTS
jgi:anti-sigma factor RsiW